MHVLDGPDLFQLSQERPDRPMHTLKVAVLEGPIAADEVERWAATTLVEAPPLRWVLAGPRWARPVWVDGGVPDVTAQVDHVVLPAPGGEAELDARLSAAAGDPLDRSRPLWHLTHVTGLAGGRDALVFRIHHAIADGAGSVSLWEELADRRAGEPTAEERLGAIPWVETGSVPRHALATGARDLGRLPALLARFGRAQRRLRADARAGRPTATKPFLGPGTRFNGEPEAGRRVTFAPLPLARLAAVRAASGASLTEVYLAVVGGAVRRHLEALGEPVDGTLTTNVPIGLPSRPHRYGNGTTVVSVSLCTDVVDGAARLDAVRASIRAARASTAHDPRLLPDLQRFRRLNGGIVRAMEAEERRRGRPAYNLICSSVRGPAPFSILGLPVAELRSVGPLAGHFGLNLTAWSYRDDLMVGVHAYASAGDGLQALGPLLLDELDRTAAAVGA